MRIRCGSQCDARIRWVTVRGNEECVKIRGRSVSRDESGVKVVRVKARMDLYRQCVHIREMAAGRGLLCIALINCPRCGLGKL